MSEAVKSSTQVVLSAKSMSQKTNTRPYASNTLVSAVAVAVLGVVVYVVLIADPHGLHYAVDRVIETRAASQSLVVQVSSCSQSPVANLAMQAMERITG